MVLAQNAVRDDDVRIAALATQLGYAFRREVGEAPLRYLGRLRRAS